MSVPFKAGFGNLAKPDFTYLHSGNSAEKFPPAGGMGDWGEPQQARLSYKRYACASAAHGGVGCSPPMAGRFLRGRLIPIQADTVRTFSRKKKCLAAAPDIRFRRVLPHRVSM